MIGDNYEADILGAHDIGMDTIFFDITKQNLNGHSKQIDNLIHIKKYL